ncbi:hypothetical protein CGT94_17265 [Vibrio metoecus]|nr:hypothetical protein CGT95_18325 [Vibrio metoecus]PAR47317.1 hypothetical protein CGT94_17265 [Vibrio metoecus]
MERHIGRLQVWHAKSLPLPLRVLTIIYGLGTILHLTVKFTHNKRLKRDCQRVAFPVPMSRSGYGCCV